MIRSFLMFDKHPPREDNAAKLIFVDHMKNGLVDAVNQGNEQEVLGDIKKALDNFIR